MSYWHLPPGYVYNHPSEDLHPTERGSSPDAPAEEHARSSGGHSPYGHDSYTHSAYEGAGPSTRRFLPGEYALDTEMPAHQSAEVPMPAHQSVQSEIPVPDLVNRFGQFPLHLVKLLADVASDAPIPNPRLTELFENHYTMETTLARKIGAFNRVIRPNKFASLEARIKSPRNDAYLFTRLEAFHHFERINALADEMPHFNLNNRRLTVRQLYWVDFLRQQPELCTREDLAAGMQVPKTSVCNTIAILNEGLEGTNVRVAMYFKGTQGQMVETNKPTEARYYMLVGSAAG